MDEIDIKKILYVGANLNINIIKKFDNVKNFVFIDSQPRSKDDRYYFSDRDYNSNFMDKLLIIMYENGFKLSKNFSLNNDYYTKILNFKKKIYYSIFNLPAYINPELFIFENNQTKQVIKYYISTNINYNMNESLYIDLINSDTLLLNEYLPSLKLFDYLKNCKILIANIDTNFSPYHENIDYISSLFDKFYLFNSDFTKECKDFMDLILEKIKIINKNKK